MSTSRYLQNQTNKSGILQASFAEQVRSHLTFLRENLLDVEELIINVGDVQCSSFNYQYGIYEGQYRYRSSKVKSDKIGQICLTTWCHGPFNREDIHRTYGKDEEE